MKLQMDNPHLVTLITHGLHTIIGRIMGPQRYSHSNPQNLWLCRYGIIKTANVFSGHSTTTQFFKSRTFTTLAGARHIKQRDPRCEGFSTLLCKVHVQGLEKGSCERGQPPAGSQQGNGNLCLATTKNWILPATWISLEADPSQSILIRARPANSLILSLGNAKLRNQASQPKPVTNRTVK